MSLLAYRNRYAYCGSRFSKICPGLIFGLESIVVVADSVFKKCLGLNFGVEFSHCATEQKTVGEFPDLCFLALASYLIKRFCVNY